MWELLSPYRRADMVPEARHNIVRDTSNADGASRLYKGQEDFLDAVLSGISIDVLRLGGFAEDVFSHQEGYELRKQAQQLDYYYACMVKGAGVKARIDTIWTAGDQPVPAFLDEV